MQLAHKLQPKEKKSTPAQELAKILFDKWSEADEKAAEKEIVKIKKRLLEADAESINP